MSIDKAVLFLRTCRAGDGTPHIECEWCGGCVHGCRSDMNHIAWFIQFPALGEPECAEIGAPSRYMLGQYGARKCQMPVAHEDIHKRRDGWQWPVPGVYDIARHGKEA